ncbi:hypothetical protein PanWU01x14_361540 [Parasponia andersonii]|uniref:Uncharacterized protein n=1 Tax=Parasponia andersonii TaxID=3476 RepID=A0A2P5A784_PARAD|nr:hypothetical protein PanWU01x14_361540 [Parasponia andersonii]
MPKTSIESKQELSTLGTSEQGLYELGVTWGWGLGSDDLGASRRAWAAARLGVTGSCKNFLPLSGIPARESIPREAVTPSTPPSWPRATTSLFFRFSLAKYSLVVSDKVQICGNGEESFGRARPFASSSGKHGFEIQAREKGSKADLYLLVDFGQVPKISDHHEPREKVLMSGGAVIRPPPITTVAFVPSPRLSSQIQRIYNR